MASTQYPNDPAHATQAGSAAIVDVVSRNTVVLDKEPSLPTNGHVRVDSVAVAAPAGGTGVVDKAWPYDVAIYSVRAAVTEDCLGCALTIDGAPRTTAGTLTADAPDGATVLYVSPTVTANAYPGYVVTLQQGAAEQELGEVSDVDPAAGTITVVTPVAGGFSAAGPTLVQLTQRAAGAMELTYPGHLTFGENQAVAVPFPRGKTMRLSLSSPNAAPARLVVYVSHNY